MSIRRSARKPQGFTVVDNAVFSSELSFRAMGLLTYLLSKPDHWQVSVAQLVRYSKATARPDGRDSIYSILDELINARFVVREFRRSDCGKLAGIDYVVHDAPLPAEPETAEPPFTDLPYTAEPDTAEPTQVNTEVVVKTEGVVTTDPAPPEGDASSAFETFWQAGMRKHDKRQARKAFAAALKRSGKPPDDFSAMLVRDVKARLCAGQLGFDRMHPKTYLNNDRWEDEIVPADSPPANQRPRPRHTGLEVTGRGLEEQDDGTFGF